MKRVSLFLMAVVMVLLAVTTSQAASVGLLYDYSFDGNADNIGGPGNNGTLAGTTLPTFEAGVIGQAINTGTAGYVTLGTTGIPQAIGPYAAGSTGGFWTGTYSFWTNSTPGQNAGTNWWTGWNTTSGQKVNTGIYQNYASSEISYYAQDLGSAAPLHQFQLRVANGAATVDIEDNNWHLVTVSYNLTTGASGTGSGQIWFDGIAQTVNTTGGNSIVGNEVIASPTTNSIATDLGNDRSWGFDGKLDDMARWYTQLNDGQAVALYNLGKTGVAGTVYNAVDATSLFDGYLNATGATTSDAKSWNYVASGLSGAAGTVGANYVVLGPNGGGMQVVPEPGALSLLAAGALGLLVFAWRKRK